VIPLSPALFVSAANALVAVSGDRVWRGGGASLIHHVGYRSHFDHGAMRSSWPLPQADDCEHLARLAAARGILSTGWPRAGEIVVFWSGMERTFTRAAIIVRAESAEHCHERARVMGASFVECLTIESGGSAGEGTRARLGLERGVRETVRKISCEKEHRFIRWVDLDGRARAADPVPERVRCEERMREARAA